MILEMLAAAAVAAGEPADAAPAPGKDAMRMETGDDWIHKPDNATILSIWPAAAHGARVSARRRPDRLHAPARRSGGRGLLGGRREAGFGHAHEPLVGRRRPGGRRGVNIPIGLELAAKKQ